MDRDEVEALSAIYGDLAEVRADGSVAVAVQSSDESREALLLLTASSLYPASAPHLAVEGRRGVKNETLLAIRTELENEAKELLGMPMAFALAEKLKQLLDTDDLGSAASVSAAVPEPREDEKPKNHQVGEPLITQGTRCTENVFMEWREKWLEKRAAQIAERQKRQEAEADGKLTGKQMFLAARDDDKAARALLSQLIADENVDESLFAGE